jgi:hypothetical protein
MAFFPSKTIRPGLSQGVTKKCPEPLVKKTRKGLGVLFKKSEHSEARSEARLPAALCEKLGSHRHVYAAT